MTESQKYSTKYSSAFNAGGMLYSEVCAVLPLLTQENFVNLLDQEAKENKLLKIKTESARTRIVTELKRRARAVDSSFWTHFESWQEQEQKLGLFYLILKAYPLAFDFHFEVVIKKWKSLDYHLDKFDLQMRLDEISSQDEEVAQWTNSTRTKLLTVFMRILREAGLLGRTTLRKPVNISPSFWEYYADSRASWFLEACFLSKTERETYL